MRILIALVLAAVVTAPLAAQPLVMKDWLGRAPADIIREHDENLAKGQELYDLKRYKESIPYLDKAIFLSQVLIEQARLAKEARELLEQARQAVGKAGKIIEKKGK